MCIYRPEPDNYKCNRPACSSCLHPLPLRSPAFAPLDMYIFLACANASCRTTSTWSICPKAKVPHGPCSHKNIHILSPSDVSPRGSRLPLVHLVFFLPLLLLGRRIQTGDSHWLAYVPSGNCMQHPLRSCPMLCVNFWPIRSTRLWVNDLDLARAVRAIY